MGRQPGGPDGLYADLKGVTAIAAGNTMGLALRGEGTVAQWGGLGGGSAPPVGLSNVVAIAAGGDRFQRNLALKRAGTVVAWGPESDYRDATPPPGLSNVVAIAVGERHSLALKADGTVVGWGDNTAGEATGVPTEGHPWRVSSGSNPRSPWPAVLSPQPTTVPSASGCDARQPRSPRRCSGREAALRRGDLFRSPGNHSARPFQRQVALESVAPRRNRHDGSPFFGGALPPPNPPHCATVPSPLRASPWYSQAAIAVTPFK